MAEVKRSRMKVEENVVYEDARQQAIWELTQFQKHREPAESINKFDLRWDYVNKCPRGEPLPAPVVDNTLKEVAEAALTEIVNKKASRLEMKQEEIMKELDISRSLFNKTCKGLFGLGWGELNNEQKQEVIDSFGEEAME